MTLFSFNRRLALITLLTAVSPFVAKANYAHIVNSEIYEKSVGIDKSQPVDKQEATLKSWLTSELSAFCSVKYEKELKKHIIELCSRLGAGYISVQKESIEKSELKAKDAEKAILALDFALRELTPQESIPALRMIRVQQTQRMLYSLYAEIQSRTNILFSGSAPEPRTVDTIFKAFNKFFLTHSTEGTVTIPATATSQQPLNPLPTNPYWYSAIRSGNLGAEGHWKTLETRMAKLVGAHKKIHAYNFNLASRVLIYKKTKESASSPKIEAKDLFGIDWKVKWGDEIQPEAIANRLYVGAGGKYNDLVYVKGPNFELENGSILLIESDSAEAEEVCDGAKVVNAAVLVSCLKGSKYQSNITPYILDQGKLSERSDISTKVKRIAESLGKSIKGTEFFVIFRESSVEFQGEGAFMKIGPIAMAGVGSEQDPVLRSMMLFNMWIANRDVKEDNGRSILMSREAGGQTYYYESIHDQGYSLGSAKAGGEVAKFSDTFMSRRGNTISFNEPLLYLPDIYSQVTVRDLNWMAQNILALKENDLRWAVDQTNWPEFMKVALLRKLISRQINMAEVLGLPVSTDLRQSLAKYSQDYVISLVKTDSGLSLTGQLGSETPKKVYLDANVEKLLASSASTAKMQKTEKVLSRGELSPCTPTEHPVQDLLIRAINPSGFYQRITRLTDHLPTEEQSGCNLRAPNFSDTKKYLFAR